MVPLALSLLAGEAHAQACVCSRGVALPNGNVLRPWAGLFTLDYGLALSGAMGSWTGVGLVDIDGDSMAGMFMPPHLVQTASLTATLGLPAAFSVSATVPYLNTHHVGESGMPGDVDSSALGDVGLNGRWVHKGEAGRAFVGLTAGLTFPTGKVVADSPVRAGRGVLGGTAAVSAGRTLAPKVGVAAQLLGSTGFGADEGGYTVGPSASLVAGAWWTPRENGRLSLAWFAMERWGGKDRHDGTPYDNTGYLSTDLAMATSYSFWEAGLRSASVALRVQAPVYQVVGDPMYAENFGAGVSVSVIAF